jgi:hypothetical protein
MPKTTKGGAAKKSELPSTLQRSSAKAQRTFAKTHDAAAEEYGSEERAHRVRAVACGQPGSQPRESMPTPAKSTCSSWPAVSTSPAGPL